jgi:integrase/recombinase XerD
VAGSADVRVVEKWLTGKWPKRPQTTLDAYRRDWQQFHDWSGRVPLRLLTTDHLEHYGEHMVTLGYAIRTRNRKLSAIKSLLSFGQATGYLQWNVGAAVGSEGVKDQYGQRDLSIEQVAAVLTGEPDTKHRLALELLFYSGMRRAELCGLSWDDLRDGKLTVFGKGERTRVVMLPAWLNDKLEAARQTGSVFSWNNDQLHYVVKRALERAGVDSGSCHRFRHAHANIAVANGAPLPSLQATLGHASLGMTGKYLNKDADSGNYLPEV